MSEKVKSDDTFDVLDFMANYALAYGPWKYTYNEDKAWCEIETESHAINHEKYPSFPDRGYAVGIIYDSPGCDNGRLVASAPDMYQALKLARNWLVRLIDDEDINLEDDIEYIERVLATAVVNDQT